MAGNGVADQQGQRRTPKNPPAGRAPSPGGNGGAPAAPANPAARPDLKGAQSGEMRKASAILMDDNQIQTLGSNISALNSFINHSYMAQLQSCRVLPMSSIPANRSSIGVYEVTKLMLSEGEDTYEKMVSLYASLYGMNCTVGVILRSDGEMVHVYLCTCCNDGGSSASLLRSSVLGHFPGSELVQLEQAEVDALMGGVGMSPKPDRNGNYPFDKHVRALSIVPSRREEEKENRSLKLSAQGIEKFIDGMIGRKYTVLFLAEPIGAQALEDCKRGYESLYTLLSPFAKETVSYGENESDATSFSLSVNMSKSISEGVSRSYGTSRTKGTSGGRGSNSGFSSHGEGFGFSSGSCWNSGWNDSNTVTNTDTDTKTGTETLGDAEQSGDTRTTGMSRTVNLTREIKMVQNSMQRLDAEIQRIEASRGFGMWNCCCYVISGSSEMTYMGASSLQSLLCGDAAYGGQSYTNSWSCIAKNADASNLLTNLSYMQHPWLEYAPPEGSSVESQIVSPSMMVSGRDLPTLLSLPKRSVPGMQVATMAEFGRNFPRDFEPARPIEFGNVMHMGKEEPTKMKFDLDRFAAHCFICGAAGSGKSNTTYNLLDLFNSNGIPFLVIEPAKGEYKTEFGAMPGIQVFTCKPDGFRMLNINPFEFHKNVHIKEHLAYLNSVISACWPLYGPMPAMLKDAFEEAYISCGWDLELSQRIVRTGKKFPTFADVLPALERIIDESTYSGESKGDYKGALSMRVKMLMNGFEGQIFGSAEGIPDSELFEQSAVVDLSSIGNPETRALIMGVLIIRLREYRFATQKEANSSLQHVTVLEEAHNILKRCSHESSQDSGNVQGASVSMLVDCIAEMRSSGEGFLIIDQSPGAVDEAALKNTAIKIVMRLPEKKDCEAIGATLSLREDQMMELSRFDRGVAAVYHEGWDETVLGRMGKVWSTTAHAKAYHLEPAAVDRTELLRVKGALCQWLCARCMEDELDELENMLALDRLISSLKAAKYAPSVNENLWKDIRQQLSQFVSELKDNINEDFGSISDDGLIAFRKYLGAFLRRFLQIDGAFRLNPLKLPDYESANFRQPTPKQTFIIGQWWARMKEILSYYVLLPVQCDVKPLRWTTDTNDGEYMGFLFKRIMESYGDEYDRSHPLYSLPGVSVYHCALRQLDMGGILNDR